MHLGIYTVSTHLKPRIFIFTRGIFLEPSVSSSAPYKLAKCAQDGMKQEKVSRALWKKKTEVIISTLQLGALFSSTLISSHICNVSWAGSGTHSPGQAFLHAHLFCQGWKSRQVCQSIFRCPLLPPSCLPCPGTEGCVCCWSFETSCWERGPYKETKYEDHLNRICVAKTECSSFMMELRMHPPSMGSSVWTLGLNPSVWTPSWCCYFRSWGLARECGFLTGQLQPGWPHFWFELPVFWSI